MRLPLFEESKTDADELFDDENAWIVPDDFIRFGQNHSNKAAESSELFELNELKQETESMLPKTSKDGEQS